MQNIIDNEFSLTNSAVALGKFEGLHRGHQLLFEEIVKRKKENLQSVIFTFDMPPGLFFHKEDAKKQLYTKAERHTMLEKWGIDILVEYPFTKEFASLEPEAFIRNVLIGQLDAKVIVVGEDFRFGKKRSGSIADLKKYQDKYGYELVVFPKLQEQGQDISSSTIKKLLAEAKMSEIQILLGRPFSIIGQVVHGKALGRTINIPTANQEAEEGKALPPNGVYLSAIHCQDGSYYGITNIGTKPTVDQGKIRGIETHVFDFNGDLYGQVIEVDLLEYCRPEMKFESLQALVAQMTSDINSAKELVAKF